MSTVTGPGSVAALLGALDYAREGIERGLDTYARAAEHVAGTAAAGDVPAVHALVTLREARLQVAAAAKVLERLDRGLGSLLDVRA
jgi:hypothetical protein